MKFSFQREIITPGWSMRMAGYAGRVEPSIGVYDDLYLSILMLDDGAKKVLIASFDLCDTDKRFAKRIKEAAKSKYGLNEEDVIIHSIHTHTGPVATLDWRLEPGSVDYNNTAKYLEMLEEKTLACMDKCMASPKEGSMEIGTGETYIGMSRRQKLPDGVRIGPDPDTEIDRLAHALTIRNDKGEVEVIVFSCSCHPVTLYSRCLMISADYPGAARVELEKKFPGASAMFLQGPGADINPAILAIDDDYRSIDTHYSDVLFLGRVLANDINNIIQRGMKKINLLLKTVSGKILLPLDGNPTRELRPDEADVVQGQVETQMFKLSEDVRIVTLNGEVCNQVGIRIRELFDSGYTIVLGYTNTNGTVGYIPTGKILREGGYEARTTRFYQKYASNIEDVLLPGLDEIKKQIL